MTLAQPLLVKSGDDKGLAGLPDSVNTPIDVQRLVEGKMRALAHGLKHGSLVAVLFTMLVLVASGAQADIFFPGSYPRIQAAIDASAPGDVIHLAAGRYAETLSINKSLTITGSGTSNCVVYCLTNIPIISISGPAVVTLANFEIEGGQYMGSEWYSGFSGFGIVASNANLVLNNMVMNQFINYFVTVKGGSLAATNVALWTRNVLGGCDVGLGLDGCTAVVSGLAQDAGHLDHTINVNGLSTNHADVTITSCRIRTSSLDYGNCVRTYVNSDVRISNCFLYRGTGETVPAYPTFNHSGISVNGYSNTVTVTGNIFSNVPWAVFAYGSLGGNQVLVESNQVLNSSIGGVVLLDMNYRGIDLGGGGLGSRGGNVFSELPAPGSNYFTDVLFTNGSGFSSANIFALHNTWSNPTNKESVIYDKLDNPVMGRLLTDDLAIKTTGRDQAGRPVITWNERGAGEHYTVETCSNLTAGAWINAAGSWPIINPSLNDVVWTNPAAVSSNVFFRVRSQVP